MPADSFTSTKLHSLTVGTWFLALQSVPPFTHDVQRWIYESQNPEPGTCSEQKYLLGYQTDKQGLGSTFHVAASFLGNALHVRRLHLQNPAAGNAANVHVLGIDSTQMANHFARAAFCVIARCAHVSSFHLSIMMSQPSS